MILPKDFRVTVAPKEEGVRVRITHQPTGRTAERDLPRGASFQVAERQLRAQLLSSFFKLEEFELRVGRAVGGGLYEVVHLPTGRSQRRVYSREQKVPDDIVTQLIDALLMESES